MTYWKLGRLLVISCVAAVGLIGCSSGDSSTTEATSPTPTPTQVAPTITTQPAALSVAAGATTGTFTVVATGTPAPTYQWQRDGSNISGATSASYTVAVVTPADTGAVFRVVVTNAAGSATSNAAALTVTAAPAAPSISAQPVSTTVAVGTSANFSVQADSASPLTYQWQRDGTNITGAVTATYAVASPALADSGSSFRVVVTNAGGSVTSAAALLSVVADAVLPPTITAQPQSASTLEGATAGLTVAASGNAPFSYQWRRNGTAIAGAAAASYTTPALALSDSGVSYSVVVTNGAGSITSANATITVNPNPVTLTAQPVSAVVATGQTASFAITATGSAPITYQWRRGGVAISGATAASYTTPAAVAADNGALFSVVVTNGAGSVTSSNAALTVNTVATAPTISAQPGNLTVFEGQPARFAVTAAGAGTLTYQWRRNAVNITGATAASYTLAAAALADNSARYSVVITNATGTVTSADATLTVQAATSALIGRNWVAGQSLEENTGTVSVLLRDYAIDDLGRVTVVFQKNNGTRNVLYATRGTPNAAGTAPSWTAPVPIDVLGTTPVSNMGTPGAITVRSTPGGDVVALWAHIAACTASTYSTSLTGNCRYHYVARYRAASNTWEAPALVTDAPDPDFQFQLNDRGDLAFLGKSWVRSGTSGYTTALALFVRSPTETTFRRQLLNSEPISVPKLGLDAAGNLLLAAEYAQNATTDIAAYRGTVAAGLATPPQVLDTRGSAASLDVAAVGQNGQQLVVWTQNNGVKNTTYAAVSSTASGSFAVTDLDFVGNSTSFRVPVASDDGRVLLYSISGAGSTRLDWSATGGWSARFNMPSALPSNNYYYTYGINRMGDMLVSETIGCCSYGGTATYDAQRNLMITTVPTASVSPGYPLGFSKSGMGYGGVVLALNGIGFTDILAKYDTLPTPAMPAGDGRAVTNLWGVFLK